MACRSEQRVVAPKVEPQTASWNVGPESEVSVMSENVPGSQSAYSLAPALRLPPVKSPSPSAYAQSIGLTDTVILREVVHVIDDFGLPEFTAVAASYGQDRFGYVVTPNVDHLISSATTRIQRSGRNIAPPISSSWTAGSRPAWYVS
jgi:hypothetical protein